MREPAPGSGTSGAVVGGVDAAEEAAVRTPVRCSPSNLPTLVTPGAAIPKIPQVSSSFEGKPFQLSNSVITNCTGPPIFVRYGLEFVITVIVITEFDCSFPKFCTESQRYPTRVSVSGLRGVII